MIVTRFYFLIALLLIATGFTEEPVSCPPISIIGEVNLSYDNFHAISDGSWNGNTGGVVGCNFGCNIFNYFGLQIGGSYAAYNWYGKGSITNGTSSMIEQQEFVSGGLFRRSSCQGGVDGLQGGVAVDWMFNQGFGIFALNPNLGQCRLQLGYLFKNEELGAFGTINLNTVHNTFLQLPISYRAISQISLFWRHIFSGGAETMLWGGVPYKQSLMIDGKREGSYLIGFDFHAPLSQWLRLDANGVYMAPVGNTASPQAFNYDSNICIGITYVFPIKGIKGCSRCTKARPYLPIAGASNFLVATNFTN